MNKLHILLSLITTLGIFATYHPLTPLPPKTNSTEDILLDSIPLKNATNTVTHQHNHSHTHKPGEFCAFDDLQKKYPQFKKKQDSLENILYRSLKSGQSFSNDRIIYTIPVVVHVVHNNGAGNIPFTQVQTAIQHMNDAFANVGYYNPNTGVDIEIQFCLAQRDPMGNTTNGMTQTVSTLSNLDKNTQDLQLKNLIRWDPTQYINIWTVGNIIGGVAGYAYLPSAHGANVDGIVLEAGYMGTSTSNTTVLVHEMGHYLGLYHPFQGGCPNNDCLQDGDKVCDTPPDNTTSRPACNTPPNSCTTDEDDTSVNNPFRAVSLGGLGDQPDLIRDYMDYSNFTCYDRFTQGQKDRMRFFLTGIRASLLNSQGCVPACTNPINIGFTASANTISVGSNVTFTNTTTNATSYEWFNDGVSFATTTNSNVTFNSVGTYTIFLSADNGDPNCLAQDSMTITVTCPVQADYGFSTSTILVGQNAIFTNTSTNATSYIWSINGTTTSTATNLTQTFNTPGVYTVCLEVSNGLCNVSKCQNFLVYLDTFGCDNGTFQKLYGGTGDESIRHAIETQDGGIIGVGYTTSFGSGDRDGYIIKTDYNGVEEWSLAIGNSNRDLFSKVIQDNASDYIISGYTADATNTNKQNWIIKLSNTGSLIWSLNLGGINQSHCVLTLANNGDYIMAGYENNSTLMVITRINSAGTVLWSKSYDASNSDWINDIKELSNGDLVIAGSTFSSGAGAHDGVVFKTNSLGNLIWAKTYGTTSDDGLDAITIGHNGNILVAGFTKGGSLASTSKTLVMELDLNGNILWTADYGLSGRQYRSFSISPYTSNSYLVHIYDYSTGNKDFKYLNISNTGAINYGKSYGNVSTTEQARSITHLTNKSLLIAGKALNIGSGGEDVFWIKTDSLGNSNCQESIDAPTNFSSVISTAPFSLTETSQTRGLANSPILTPVSNTANTLCFSPCTQEICGNGIDDNQNGQIDEDCTCSNTFVKILGESNTNEGGLTTVQTTDGNFWTGGYKGDTALLVKTNPNGYVLWEGSFKFTTRADIILSLHVDSEGYIIGAGMGDAGTTGRTAFAFKFDPYTNQIIWSNVFDNDGLLMTIEENPVNNNYLFGGGRANAENSLFTELDRNTGAVVLSRQYHLGTDEDFYASTIHANNIYLSSRFVHTSGTAKMRANISKLDMNGNILWNKVYLTDPANTARQYGLGLELDADSLVMAYAGHPTSTTIAGFRTGLVKTDLNGNLSWASEYTLTGYNTVGAYNMAKTPDGYLLFGFAENSQKDVVLIKTDKLGNALWAKTYGGLGLEDMCFNSNNRIVVTDQNYYFSARTQSFGGNDDLVLIKTDTSGNVQTGCTFVQDIPVNTVFLTNPYEATVSLTNTPSTYTDDLNTPNITLLDLPELQQCEEPCQEICDNGLDDDGDGLIDCFDPDCCNYCPDFYYNACPATCQTTPVAKPFDLQLEWSSPSVWHEFNTPIVGDLDGDGMPEIIGKEGPYASLAQSNLVVIDGATGQVETTINTSFRFKYGNVGPTIADTDNNGIPEIFIMSSENPARRIFSYEYDGNNYVQKWMSNTQVGASMGFVFTSEWNVQVADFNQDGVSELYVINEIYNAQTGEFLVDGGNNNTGRINKTYGYGQWEALPVAADVLPDNHCADCRGLELIAGGQVYSVHIDPVNPVNNRMTVEVDASNIERMGDGFTAIADMDRDGDLDAVVTTAINDLDSVLTNDSVAVFIWDIQTANLLAPPFGFLDNINGPTISLANISDVDNDGSLNIGITSYSKFKMLEFENGQITQMWNVATTDGSGRTGTIVFDFNADGNKEVVYRDETLLRIFNGSTGVTLFSTSCTSFTGWEYPVVADVDNDAQTELLCSCDNNLRAYGSNSFPWVTTRPLWNQHSFFNVNINSDLTVPKVQQDHHLVGNKMEMNSFLNPHSNPESAVADAVPTIDTIYCAGDSIILNFTICNTGDFALSSQTPISIYNADPTTSAAATTIAPIQTIGQNILVDSCLSFSWKLPQTFGPFFLVANDNASLSPIYDLSSDFPVTTIAECNYSNNLDSFTFNPANPSLELGPDTTVCENGIFVFNAGSGFASYRWQDGHPDSTYTAFTSGLYWVEVVSACGDTLRDSVIVTMDTVGLVSLGADTTICIGNSVVLSVLDSANYVYQWTPNSTLSCDTCSSTTATPILSTLYELVVTNNIGCVSTDSIMIMVENCDTLIFTDTTLCLGDSLILNATMGNAIAYQWQDGSTASYYTVNSAGMYGVTVSLSDGDSILAGLMVSYTNCAIISSTLDTILCNGDSLIVDATNPNATAYQWQDGSTASSYTINTAGSYWVYTTLTNGSQLQDTTNVSYTNCAIIGSTLDTILCNGDSLIVDVTNPNAT
ncbi:MAG: hypothetical protein GY810_29330, partial [Aureispira sp.]|nr:hypothetical protein [Aureispira sp.]